MPPRLGKQRLGVLVDRLVQHSRFRSTADLDNRLYRGSHMRVIETRLGAVHARAEADTPDSALKARCHAR